MPYASEAQRRKFHYLLSIGKISPEVVKEFDEASKGLSLPERIHPKKEPTKAPSEGDGVYTVKSAEADTLDNVLHRLKGLSPGPERSDALVRSMRTNAKVPIKDVDNPTVDRHLAFYNSGAREVHMGPHANKMPGILAHELGHADAHHNGNFLDRAVNTNAGRIAGAGVGVMGGLAAGMLPKWWHKVLAGTATAAIGAGTVMHGEREASRRSHAIMADAGATPEELAQNRDLQRYANGTYVKTLWPFAAAPVVGAGIHALMKHAGHAADRMDERTGFHPSNVQKIQKLVDLMGLAPATYHLPLRDEGGGVGGYAVFKGVKNRKNPVLATVLAKDMRPPGEDIEHMFKTPPKLKFKTS